MPITRYLRAWIHRTKARAPDFDAKSNYPAILCLPLDVWLLFLDNLSLHDQLRLSHTCKNLRVLAGRHLPDSIRNLRPLDEPFEGKMAFASLSLDYEACINCNRIHAANVKDIPLGNLTRDRPCEQRLFSRELCVSYLVMGPTYRLKHRHVQLALKYHANRARLGATHKQHLEELMKPCQIWGKREPLCDLTFTENIHLHYRARPKIVAVDSGGVDHVLRYIMYEEWTFLLDSSPEPEAWTWDTIEKGALWGMNTCKHQDYGFWPRPSTAGPGHDYVTFLTTHLEILIDSRQEKTITFSCRHCPTDICLRLFKNYKGRQCIWVGAWKDIRTTKKEWDRRLERIAHMSDESPPEMEGYVPGITRYLYENDGRRPETGTEWTREVPIPSSRSGWACRAFAFFKKGEQNKKEGVNKASERLPKVQQTL